MNKPRTYFFTLLNIFFCYLSSTAQIPTFPGAEGFGVNTPGGRGGQVIQVTTLADYGPGSLRQAVRTEGPRIIVFAISGVINLETKLVIKDPWVTIAGQTAPGDGICLRGEGIRVKTHDVVIRHLRIRPGDIDFGPPNKWDEVDAISIAGDTTTHNIVIDHCSLSWSVDEVIGMWNEVHDITIQNCIISEALNNSKHPTGAHGMGMLIGSKATNISVHHNLFAHNSDRNPLVNGVSKVDIRNNVIFDPGRAAIDLTGRKGQQINLVNNYLIRGPVTKLKANIHLRDTADQIPKLYVTGNVGIDGRTAGHDNWLMIRNVAGQVPDRVMQREDPFPHARVTTQPASVAYERVLEEAGATLPRRDAVDRKIIRDIEQGGGGTVDRKSNPLGWPPFRQQEGALDTDQDGMPDFWEQLYGLPADDPNDRQDPDRDGYTNIEEYINGTDPWSGQNNTGINPQGRTASISSNQSDDFELRLAQNYPNPFAQTTQVKLTIDQAAPVSMRVFDLVGREVTNIVQELLYEGEYEFLWDASHVPPGIYIINLSTAEFSRSIKAVIERP